MTVDRRTFLQRTSYVMAGAAISQFGATRRVAASSDWGAALYTVHGPLATDAERVLDALAGIGYSKVEVTPSHRELIPKVKAAGLDATSLLVDTPTITGDASAWSGMPALFRSPDGYSVEAAIDDAQQHGVRFLVAFYLMPQERSLDSYRRLIDAMNRAGEQCKAAGLELCYHHHAFEFGQVEGEVPMELLIAGYDPAYVNFEIDVFWVALSGRDPVEYLRRLGPRVRLLHLKDQAADTPPGFDDTQVSPEAFVELGRGVIDVKGVLDACRDAGVAHVFVEQDHSVATGDPLESLKISYEYLNSLEA